MWVQAPFLLVRFPALLLAVAGATFILVAAVASGPLFQSSAQNASLEKQLSSVSTWNAGITVVATGTVGGPLPAEASYGVLSGETLYSERERLLREATASLPDLTPAVHTLIGSAGEAVRADAPGTSTPVRLLYRDGGLQRIERLAGPVGAGVWIPDRTAKALHLRPGDSMVLTLTSGIARVPVSGIYRDLSRAPLPDFWTPLYTYVEPAGVNQLLPPAVAMADRATFARLESRLADVAAFRWEYPLRSRRITIERARVLAAGIQQLEANVKGAVPPYRSYFHYPTVLSLFPDALAQAEATAFTLRGPVDTLAIAAVIVALALAGATGVYWLHRRRVEFRQLASRAAHASALGVRTMVEALLPVTLAGVAAWFATRGLIRVVGPSTLVSPQAVDVAARHTIWTVGGAILLIGAVVAMGIPRQLRAQGGRVRDIAVGIPWEVVLFALAAASFYEITSRGTVVVTKAGGPTIDRLLLLFPILFIGGASVLAVRLARFGLGRLRGVGRRWSVTWFLAFRRIAGASATALLLVAAAALSVGIVTFATALSASVGSSVEQKAIAFTGSDVAIELGGEDPSLPTDFPFAATIVTVHAAGPTLIPQRATVEIIAVDPLTFPRAAFWDPAFADEPLARLLGKLATTTPTRLPVLVLSKEPVTSSTLVIGTGYVPIDPVGQLRGFPGAPVSATALVVDRRSLAATLRAHLIDPIVLSSTDELWARGDPAAIVSAVQRAGLTIVRVTRPEEVRSSPGLLAVTWTSRFMILVGALTGLVAIVGLLLYLQARQRQREISYALCRRMGLRPASHATALLAETTGLMAMAFVLGTLFGAISALVTFSRLDPLPNLFPAMRLTMQPAAVGAVALVLAVASVAGAAFAQGRARRANAAEVLRLAP